MRPECERCGGSPAPDGVAFICSYECTFCKGCAAGMDHLCPNCGGELVARPRRAAEEAVALEAVMNLIKNGLGMRKAGDHRGADQPENSHSNTVFTQVHNTL